MGVMGNPCQAPTLGSSPSSKLEKVKMSTTNNCDNLTLSRLKKVNCQDVSCRIKNYLTSRVWLNEENLESLKHAKVYR
ncbi:hypothetical protein KIN20_007421 [Parelaphostrongylus tenuis]|uniref:Uncharacterized protein n=1 Tax=Parelaphostrongylus tenuis TaxID=148309 RepID=A0AAD5M3D9_PARTN|nr:hypothetical protein KIN20_007421 [Parelaphostrongylus tenuis]